MSMNCDVRCQGKLQGLADWVAGGCTILTFLISLFQIGKHLRHYTNPHFQRKIIIIIFMAPFYSLMSFCTIEFQDTDGYFNLVRDIYEAVLIYAFFNLLASYLAYDEEKKEIDYERIYEALQTKGVTKHMCPMSCCFKPILLISRIRARWFFREAKLFILQYLAIKPMVSFFLIIIAYVAPDGHWGIGVRALASVSVVLSVYYLVLFYRILHKELAFARPLLKFLSIKGVLFFTFWQDFVVVIFRNKIAGHFDPLGPDGLDLIIAELESMLVCFEMVLLTILTTIAFSYRDFKNTERMSHGASRAGLVTLTKRFVGEVVADGVAIAFNDLRELKEPLKDPFKSYGDANINQTDLLSISMKKQNGEIDEEDLNEVHIFVQEKPLIIPNFIGRKVRISDSSTETATKASE